MGEETTGMGANVGVKKRDEEGEVTETAGAVDGGTTRRGWAIFWVLVGFAMLGLWKLAEILMSLL